MLAPDAQNRLLLRPLGRQKRKHRIGSPGGDEAVTRREAVNGSSAQTAGSVGATPPGDRLLRSSNSHRRSCASSAHNETAGGSRGEAGPTGNRSGWGDRSRGKALVRRRAGGPLRASPKHSRIDDKEGQVSDRRRVVGCGKVIGHEPIAALPV
jgi:hypothetical protein